jgi:hypothetical protein
MGCSPELACNTITFLNWAALIFGHNLANSTLRFGSNDLDPPEILVLAVPKTENV